MKGVFVAIALALLIGVSFGAGLGTHSFIISPRPATAQSADQEEPLGVFWEAWHIVEHEFYGKLPTPKELTEGAIRGAIKTLGDDYTVFVPPSQAHILNEDLESSFEGIGATVEMRDGHLYIVQPMTDQPAEKAGLKAGDMVIKVDDTEITADMDILQAISLIRGPKDTKVKLTVTRQGQTEPLVFEIVRAKIEMITVESKMLDGGIAYIRLYEFNRRAPDKLKAALQKAAQKPKGIILDLRSNPGGYLDVAVTVASQFIAQGPILSSRGKNGAEQVYQAESGGLATDIPLVVLINRGTASASEIVAGAIQDTGRGKLIGEKTFGKGSVQITHTLSDGSGLRVTIARWFTPNGRQIDDQGIEPDIAVARSDADLTTGRDPQLDRAIEYLTMGK
jgi:carboxyl-terminal processing protease